MPGVLVDISTSPVSPPHEIRAEMEYMKKDLADHPDVLARVLQELEWNLEMSEELYGKPAA
jgi:hypothetical protein